MIDDPLNEIMASVRQLRHAFLKNGMKVPSKIVLDPESMRRLKYCADINKHLIWGGKAVKTTLLGIEFVDG